MTNVKIGERKSSCEVNGVKYEISRINYRTRYANHFIEGLFITILSMSADEAKIFGKLYFL